MSGTALVILEGAFPVVAFSKIEPSRISTEIILFLSQTTR